MLRLLVVACYCLTSTSAFADMLHMFDPGMLHLPSFLTAADVTSPDVPEFVNAAISGGQEQVTQFASEASAIAASTTSAVVEQVTPVLTGAVDTTANVIGGAGEAVPKAFSTLGSELSVAGDKLVTNVGTGITATGDAIGEITSGLTKALSRPEGLVSVPAEVPRSSPLPEAGFKGPDLQPLFDKILSWKLFSDPDHMKNGYWEQRWTELTQLDVDVATKSTTDLVNEKANLLGGKWNNYVDGIVARANGAVSKSAELSDNFQKNWAIKWSAAGDKYSANMQALEAAREDAKKAADAAKPLIEGAQKAADGAVGAVKEYSSTVLSTTDSTATAGAN